MFCAGMTAMAAMLRDNGWLLRSGAAQGADEAFEAGAGDAKEIWLPKRGFRGHPSARTPSADAFRLAAMHHPGWRSCSPFARALHARNGHQVLGADLCTPVAFVACWTLDGSGRAELARRFESRMLMRCQSSTSAATSKPLSAVSPLCPGLMRTAC